MKIEKQIFLGLLFISSFMAISKERIGLTDSFFKGEHTPRTNTMEQNAFVLAATDNKLIDPSETISPSWRTNAVPPGTTSKPVLGNHSSILTRSKSSFSALTGITGDAMLADLNSIIADLDKYYVSSTTEYASIGHTHYAKGVPDGNPISNTDVNFDVSKALIIYPGAYYNNGAINFAFNSITTLDALGDPNAKFIIESVGAINTNIDATIRLAGGAQACNVFFVANGGISLGAATTGSSTNILVVGNWISRAGAVAVGIGTDVEGRILTTYGALAMGHGVLKVPTTGPSFIDLRSLKSFFGVTFGSSAIGITGIVSTVITGDLFGCGSFNNFGVAGDFPGPYPAGIDYTGPGSTPVGAPVTLYGNLYKCVGPSPCNSVPTFTQIAPICSGATLSLPTTSTDTTPITGTWSPAINNLATTTYTFTPTAGTCATTATMTITVNPIVTPTFTQVDPIASGALLAALPTFSTNTTPITGTWTPPLDNLVTTEYTFTPTAGLCATTATMTITVGTESTWNGTAWTNGTPTAILKVIISGDYIVAADLTALSLEVTGTANVTVPSGKNFTILGPITVEPGATLTFENNANLIQTGTTNTNTGNIILKRNSSLLLRLDYSLWSSPVANQNLLAFSPLTDVTRFYNYITSTNLYKYEISPSTTPFALGTGYLIRKPNDASAIVRTSYQGTFTGVPNNGNYNVAMNNVGLGNRFNLVGNPYPSPIYASSFIADNANNITGTLYFWRKTNDETKPSYCSYTAGTFVTNGESEVFDPNGIIRTAQGFFVEAKDASTTLIFKNTQRVANNVGQFFRTKQVESNRIWLNATDILGNFSQMAVGYVTDATQGVDAFDGKYYNDGAIALNSFLDNSNYIIQGRALPFDPADEVPLSFKATKAGDYTIAIDHTDGLFSGAQDIILKDNTTGTETDLKAGAYTFTAAAGANNSRFSLKYQKTLKVNAYTFDENSVTVFKNKGVVYVNSGKIAIENIKVFDIQGRLISEQKNVKATTTSIKDLPLGQQVLIVQITSEENQVVNKKLVN